MPKYKVTVSAKDYWTVEIKAKDELEAKGKAIDLCHLELLAVRQKEKLKPNSHLSYDGSEWDFFVDVTDNREA